MNEIERLEQWMATNGYSISALADAIGMSYDGVYQVLRVRRRASTTLKWKFIYCFGEDTAKAIFEQDTQPAEA